MSDLSRLLDGLYSDDDVAPAAEPAPTWSSDQALDEVFSTWVPGPGDDAGSAERSLVAAAVDEVAVEQAAPVTWDEPRLDTEAIDMRDLIAAEPEPVQDAPVATLASRWSPSDDDILPGKRKVERRRGRKAA